MSSILTRPDAHISFGFCGRIRTTVLEQPAPAHMQGVKALFVTDVHLRPSASGAWLEKLMAQIADSGADILLLGGDYGESAAQQERFFHALRELPPFRLGAYGVAGNNDRERLDPGQLRALMAKSGVRLLLNEAVAVEVGKSDPSADSGSAERLLAIGGVDELKYGRPRTKGLFDGYPQGAYRLLVSHHPLWPETHADLILAGHTHGGQLNAFGLTPYSVGYEGNCYPCIKGTAQKDGARMLVSSGVGYSSIPLRVGARPEINLVDFTK